jgi:DNA-directed RNA polymerase II subunit RPB2
MYSGISGKKLKAQIFIGPTFYQRLKHMVADKIHARATGPTVMMTRQPPEGRTKNGGLRFGEMERDVAIAHGMGVFLKERMMECSDLYEVHVCGICGMFASKMKTSENYHCIGCNNSNDISKIQIPYAVKLMIQELMAINILPRIQTEKND